MAKSNMDFRECARIVHDNGYQILPIRPGEKKPQTLTADEASWTNACDPNNKTGQQLTELWLRRSKGTLAPCGVGIACGYSAIAIDIDIEDPQHSYLFESKITEQYPKALVRYGKKGCAIVFRVKGDAVRYSATSQYLDENGKKAKIEILGKGKQFVASALHADTGKPYTWKDDRSPIDVKLKDLPIFEADIPERLTKLFEKVAKEKGWQLEIKNKGGFDDGDGEVSVFKRVKAPVEDMTIEIARSILDCLIESHFTTKGCYQNWIAAGMALKHQFSDDGLELWHEYSAKSGDLYNPDELENKWGDFFDSNQVADRRPVTMRSLMKDAQDYGWVMPDDLKKNLNDEECMEKVIDGIYGITKNYNAAVQMVNYGAIEKLTRYVVSQTNKLAILTKQGEIESPQKEHAFEMLEDKIQDTLLYPGVVKAWFKHLLDEGNEDEQDEVDTKPKRERYLKKLRNKVVARITIWAQMNQSLASGYGFKSDPFITESRFKTTTRNGIQRVDPFLRDIPEVEGAPDDAVIEECFKEYSEHNPYFSELLLWLAGCGFAPNRKKAYLWFHAPSDWGKTFLFNTIIGEFNLIAKLTTDEVKKAASGDPSGLRVSEIKNKLALVFNEFKAAPLTLLELEDEIRFAPKNQPRQTIEIRAKIGLSKEPVKAVAGETGVRAEFCNRFCYIRIPATASKLQDLHTFGKYSAPVFIKALQVKAREILVREIGRLRSMGEEEAAVDADTIVRMFHEEHAIEKYFENRDTIMQDHCEEIAELILGKYSGANSKREIDTKIEYVLNKHIDKVETKEGEMVRIKSYRRIIATYFEQTIENPIESQSVGGEIEDNMVRVAKLIGAIMKDDTIKQRHKDKDNKSIKGVLFPVPEKEDVETNVKDHPFAKDEEADVIDLKTKKRVG